MKVGIFGNYGHTNIGDEAILRGLLSLFMDHREIVVYSDDIAISKKVHPNINFKSSRPKFNGKLVTVFRIFFSLWRNVRENDVILIGGGGLFNTLNKTSFLIYFLILLIAKLNFKKVYLIGVSIGPVNGWFFELLIKVVFVFTSGSYLRDKMSTRYKSPHAVLIPDLALGYKIQNNAGYKGPSDEIDEAVLVSLMDISQSVGSRLHERYMNDIFTSCRELVERKGVRLILIGMDFEKDLKVCNEMHRRFKEVGINVEVVMMSDFDKLEFYFSNCCFVVGTRLHASILSVLYGVEFCAISYQEKVNNYFVSHELSNMLVNLDELSYSKIFNGFLNKQKGDNRLREIATNERNMLQELVRAICE